jgi:DNA-binding transcriptional MerR regulator
MTGIPAATLRAWERRYGFPEPERTKSSYRLYSEKDISSIRLLKSLCEQGISPSEAVRTIRARVIEDQGLVNQKQTSPQNSQSMSLRELSLDPEEQGVFKLMREQLIDSVHQFDPVLLERNIRRAMLLGSAKKVFDGVFAPVLHQVGEEWHRGSLSIAQEHLATEALGNATRDLLRLVQPDNDAKQILLACVTGELHALPLYGSALHFIQWGYRVVILGVNTPPEALAQSVSHINPDAVGLSVTCPASIDQTRVQMPEYAKACASRPFVVGGSSAGLLRAEVEQAGGLLATGSPNSVRELFEVMVTRS